MSMLATLCQSSYDLGRLVQYRQDISIPVWYAPSFVVAIHSPSLSLIPTSRFRQCIMKKIGNVYFITAVAVVGGGLFGFDTSSMSAIITTQAYLCYFQQGAKAADGKCTGPTSSVQGGITASMAAGSWLGALCSGFVCDRFGRKKAIQVSAVIW